MTGIDWAILAFVALVAVYGYAQGFLVGALSLVGFAGGALLGTRLGPLLLPQGARSPYAPLFALAGALLGGAILASGLEGLGLHLRAHVRTPVLGVVDGIAGSVLGAVLALGIVWVAGAIALKTPGRLDLKRDIQRSQVLRRLNELLPPAGLLHALARFDPFPHINGPPVNVARPPTSRIAREPGIAAAAAGVVRITGTACGLGVEGSGWVARHDLVVTNAHVVAGESDTAVQARGTGPKLSAQAVAFDSHNDVAILRVPGLAARRLSMAPDTKSGTSAAILGFPHNGPYDVEPARLGETQTTVTQDAYGAGPVTRSITSVRGLVRSGNSGGPVVDRRGRVMATIFAAAVGSGPQAGYAVPNALVRRDLGAAHGPVGTGPCAR